MYETITKQISALILGGPPTNLCKLGNYRTSLFYIFQFCHWKIYFLSSSETVFQLYN